MQVSLAKIVGFSLAVTAIVTAPRSYRAHRHNYVVNKHRQNALGTFEAFVKATEHDTATRNAVLLLQATRAIFGAQSTGYSTVEPETISSSQLAEIARSLLTSDRTKVHGPAIDGFNLEKCVGTGRRLLTPVTNALVFAVTVGLGIVPGGVLAASEAIETR